MTISTLLNFQEQTTMNNRRRNTNLLDLDNIHEESSLGEGPSESIHIPINYLEEIDDDVVECSPRYFAQVYVLHFFLDLIIVNAISF